MDEPKDTRGPAIAIVGSLGSGISAAYGPFATVDEAVELAKERPWFGSVVVELLSPPSSGNEWPRSAKREIKTFTREAASA